MQKLKIYISGKMNGLNKEQYFMLFFDKYNELRKKYPDAIIINPVFVGYELELIIELKYGRKPTYSEYLMYDLYYLSMCNAIYMLSNWHNSNGAKTELAYAQACNFQIYYQDLEE